MGMRLASSRQPFLCGFFCAVGGQWSSWEELSHWSPCHFHYKANDLESVRWPTGWAVGRIGEDHPWLSPVPGALPGLLTCTAPVFSCPSHPLGLILPALVLHLDCLDFCFCFALIKRWKKKSPLCYLYLASKLSLIFKYRPPSGFHQIWFTSTALRVIWITCKEVKCSSELTENLPKNWSRANHPFDVQSVCLPQQPSTFIFLCLQKNNPNLLSTT